MSKLSFVVNKVLLEHWMANRTENCISQVNVDRAYVARVRIKEITIIKKNKWGENGKA